MVCCSPSLLQPAFLPIPSTPGSVPALAPPPLNPNTGPHANADCPEPRGATAVQSLPSGGLAAATTAVRMASPLQQSPPPSSASSSSFSVPPSSPASAPSAFPRPLSSSRPTTDHHHQHLDCSSSSPPPPAAFRRASISTGQLLSSPYDSAPPSVIERTRHYPIQRQPAQVNKPPKPPAQCPYCGMTFKKLEHCQRHERTHTLARPYPCSVCQKTFARQDTLNRHLRLHSRVEPRNTAAFAPSDSSPKRSSASRSKTIHQKKPNSPTGAVDNRSPTDSTFNQITPKTDKLRRSKVPHLSIHHSNHHDQLQPQWLVNQPATAPLEPLHTSDPHSHWFMQPTSPHHVGQPSRIDPLSSATPSSPTSSVSTTVLGLPPDPYYLCPPPAAEKPGARPRGYSISHPALNSYSLQPPGSYQHQQGLHDMTQSPWSSAQDELDLSIMVTPLSAPATCTTWPPYLFSTPPPTSNPNPNQASLFPTDADQNLVNNDDQAPVVIERSKSMADWRPPTIIERYQPARASFDGGSVIKEVGQRPELQEAVTIAASVSEEGMRRKSDGMMMLNPIEEQQEFDGEWNQKGIRHREEDQLKEFEQFMIHFEQDMLSTTNGWESRRTSVVTNGVEPGLVFQHQQAKTDVDPMISAQHWESSIGF